MQLIENSVCAEKEVQVARADLCENDRRFASITSPD